MINCMKEVGSSRVLIWVSDVVHTRGESLQDGLEDVQTCGMTLASAYMLCHLSAAWSQFLIEERSPKWK